MNDNMKEHYYNLDFLKVAAAIFIVFHHYQQISGVMFSKFNFYGGIITWGYLVELFFMISGFLTAHSDKANNVEYFKTFVRKCCRIYPMAIIACISLIITYLYLICFGEWIFAEEYGVANILTSLLLVHQGWAIDVLPAINNPTWYLCVLLLCYIVFYIVKYIFTAMKLDKSKIWIMYLIILLFTAYGVKSNISMPFFRFSTQRGYGAFFWAVCCMKW